MKRRKTVSVTPAMGANTVAGRISTPPRETDEASDTSGSAGTPARAKVSVAAFPGLSQYFRINLILAGPLFVPRVHGLSRTASRLTLPYDSEMISHISKILIVLVTSLFCNAQAQESWVVRFKGAGPVKIGMSKSQLTVLLHEKLKEADDGSDSCYYLESRKHPHLRFMMIDNKLARIDVDGRGVPASTGIQVGDAEKVVIHNYSADLKVEAHHYIDDGHYLTARSKGGKFGIRFESEKGKIIAFYAGTFEAIQYVEGCL